MIATLAASLLNSRHRFVVGTIMAVLLFAFGLLSGCGGDANLIATDTPSAPTPRTASAPQEFKIVTLLDFDAIRSIDAPEFLTAEEAEDIYPPNERVIGVSINGDNRAYSVPMLSRHEIVNDTVGGVKIAVTW